MATTHSGLCQAQFNEKYHVTVINDSNSTQRTSSTDLMTDDSHFYAANITERRGVCDCLHATDRVPVPPLGDEPLGGTHNRKIRQSFQTAKLLQYNTATMFPETKQFIQVKK